MYVIHSTELLLEMVTGKDLERSFGDLFQGSIPPFASRAEENH
jgi:hypothetical protein